MKLPARFALLFCFYIFLLSTTFAQKSIYKINRKIGIAGDGGWDYITNDAARGLLYVSHGKVMHVVNSKEGSIIKTIEGLNGIHGIALAKEFNKGFITSGKDSAIIVFDLTTNQKITTIKSSGANPDAILYDPFSKNVFAFNGRSNSAMVISANDLKFIGNLSLSGKPEFAVTDLAGNVYVNIETQNQIAKINTASLTVEKYFSIEPGVEPSGLAIDRKNNYLISVCDKRMIVLNYISGKVEAELPIGEGSDGVAFDPSTQTAYSSNGSGTMSVVQIKKGNIKLLENFPTQKSGRTITIDTLTHHLYIPCAEFLDPPSYSLQKEKHRPSVKPGSFTILDISK